jgi:hypothetical protein
MRDAPEASRPERRQPPPVVPPDRPTVSQRALERRERPETLRIRRKKPPGPESDHS